MRLGRSSVLLACCLCLGTARPPTSEAAIQPATKPARELRVCSDPNNLPFSNEKGDGFENQLANLIAQRLHAHVSYFWWPQRRGFLRRTLNAHRCDVVMGVPVGLERILTTRPIYRSSYVFVSTTAVPNVTSLDDPELRKLRIGVPLVGDDGSNPPPVAALILRNLVQNIRGFPVYGDYREDTPPSAMLRALGQGQIDIAIAWGPLAGYYAARVYPPMRVQRLSPDEAPPGLSFVFDIAIGVREEDDALRAELDQIIHASSRELRALLNRYDFPVL